MGLFGTKTNSSDDSKDIFGRLGKEEKEGMMVNTLDAAEPAKFSGQTGKENMISSNGAITDKLEAELNGTEKENVPVDTVVKEEPKTELEQISDETAVITSGLVVSGNLDSIGSIDIFGVVDGDVSCKGKLTVSGTINGTTIANEVFANNAQITGDIQARGTVKIGQGTVAVGNITATSAVIAGAVKGNVDVNGPVIIDSSAVIAGDIKSKSVQINNGATIDGRCTQCYSEINTAQIFEKKEEAADDNLQEAVAEKESQPEPEQRNIDDVLDNIAAGKMSSSADIKDEYVNTLEK